MQARRNFIVKSILGLFSILALPLFGKTRTNKPSKKMKAPSKILKIKALSFQWETSDPFLFCVHHEDHFPKGNDKLGPATSLDGRYLGQDFIIKDGFRMYHGMEVPGFPGHPHRGFETITVVRKGIVDHADSMGATGRYGNGDVQWMTAGKGVQHSEMFPCVNQDVDNPLELFQIWLNLPAKSKMVEPHFKMIWNDEVVKVNERDANNHLIHVEVLVGKYKEHGTQQAPPDSWAAATENQVGVWNIQLDANAVWTLPAATKGINRTLYYYSGDGLQVEGVTIPHYHAVELQGDQDVNLINGNQTAKILILQGRPINEPVVQHGPFVMNTRQEIMQAFDDYQQTQFGGWPWPKTDFVHERSKGRFAQYADGKIDKKS